MDIYHKGVTNLGCREVFTEKIFIEADIKTFKATKKNYIYNTVAGEPIIGCKCPENEIHNKIRGSNTYQYKQTQAKRKKMKKKFLRFTWP